MPKRKNRKAKVSKPVYKALKTITSRKQLAAVDKIAEALGKSKGKKITLGKLLRAAGYSESVCKSPSRVTETKGFQELLAERLSDDLLTEKHEEIIKASKLDHYVFPKSETNEEIKKVIESVAGCKLVKIRKHQRWKRAYFWAPDNHNRIKAIAEAYRVRNKYPAQKHEHEITSVKIVNYADTKEGERDNATA